jgi:Tol biopolymer transport system component
MTTKLKPRRFFWSVFAALLVACGNLSPGSTPPATQAPTPTLLATLEPVSPTPTIPSVTSTATSSLSGISVLDSLRMAYVIDGNLYLQNGSRPPLQLTNSGQDWRPLFFSENGEKLYFIRGVVPFALYSINVDGKQERALVTNTLLLNLGGEYDESTTICNPTIVVNSQLVLFNTCVYPDPDNSYVVSGNRDLLSVDTETGEIKRLLSPGQAGPFYVSPDGKHVAIDTRGQIDVIDMNGKIVRSGLLTYSPSEPILLVPHIFWTQDAAALTLLLPVPTFYDTSGGAPPYTIWHYRFDNDTAVQVQLDPIPKSHNIAQVSPDGKWILYENDEQNSYILGNLREGRAKVYESRPPVYRYEWSPDSTHFLYEIGDTLYLGSVITTPTLIGDSDLIGWVDADQYLYYDHADNSIKMRNVERETELVLGNVPQALFPDNPDRFIFIWLPQ